MSEDFYDSPQRVNGYIRAAVGHNGRNLMQPLFPLLPEGASVLELGTGPGNDWEILRERYAVTGSDLSDEFLKRLRTRWPEEDFLQLDAISLDTPSTFDALYSNKVLHHLQDADLSRSITRQVDVLNPGGLICHSFWAGQGEEVYDGMYVLYQDRESLTERFGARFDILVLSPYPEFEADDSLLLIARKKS